MIKKGTLLLVASACLILLGALPPVSNPEPFTDPRDGEVYPVVRVGDLYWMQENLRHTQGDGKDTLVDIGKCGLFYHYAAALTACPEGWRLPTEKELKPLVKADKRGKINLTELLAIELCGRIDYGKHAKPDIQNTFWLDAPLSEGHAMHWHTFGEKQELHSHNVIVARRQFPVRCVCDSL